MHSEKPNADRFCHVEISAYRSNLVTPDGTEIGFAHLIFFGIQILGSRIQ